MIGDRVVDDLLGLAAPDTDMELVCGSTKIVAFGYNL
jgi:hypothetical protein